MPRIKKDREINIIHFSFFDLLFGAFGAFVFLMIMHVLSTINLVDIDIQNLVDELIKEKQDLTAQIEQAEALESDYLDLKNNYQAAMANLDEKEATIESLRSVAEENEKLNEQVATLKSASDRMQILQDENEKLKQEMETSTRELTNRIASLEQENAAYQAIGAQLDAKGDIVQSLNAEIDRLKTEIANNKARFNEERDDLNQQIAGLTSRYQEFSNKHGDIAALQEENTSLKTSLEGAREKLRNMQIAPLTLKKASIPNIVSGDKIRWPLAAVGGVPPYQWSLKGTLPPGLSLNKEDGVLTGKSKELGDYTFTVAVIDQQGQRATVDNMKISVVRRPMVEEGVSKWFVVAMIIASLFIIYVSFQRIKNNRFINKMKREGWEPRFIKVR